MWLGQGFSRNLAGERQIAKTPTLETSEPGQVGTNSRHCEANIASERAEGSGDQSCSGITTSPLGKAAKVASGTLKLVASRRSGVEDIQEVMEID